MPFALKMYVHYAAESLVIFGDCIGINQDNNNMAISFPLTASILSISILFCYLLLLLFIILSILKDTAPPSNQS